MASGRLRAVAPDEKPRQKPKTVAQAAEGGDLRELLVAMRERIAVTVSNPECPPRDLASLTRRLHEIAKQIEQIDLAESQEVASGGVDVSDEEFNADVI